MTARAGNPVTVTFPEWFDARAEHEAASKGYVADVRVQLEDGSRYRLYFIDPVRLRQTLEDDAATGRPYFTEPGLVVVPEITTEAIRRVVPRLMEEGFFAHLKPLS
jgi:hypothetical protein